MDCNRDCFNCIYEDCISDEITSEERESINADGYKTPLKERERVRRYNEAHKEQKRAYNKKYRETHKEEIRLYLKMYKKGRLCERKS